MTFFGHASGLCCQSNLQICSHNKYPFLAPFPWEHTDRQTDRQAETHLLSSCAIIRSTWSGTDSGGGSNKLARRQGAEAINNITLWRGWLENRDTDFRSSLLIALVLRVANVLPASSWLAARTQILPISASLPKCVSTFLSHGSIMNHTNRLALTHQRTANTAPWWPSLSSHRRGLCKLKLHMYLRLHVCVLTINEAVDQFGQKELSG